MFAKIDSEIVQALLRWGYKRRVNKGKRWIVKKYFTYFKGDNWRFHCAVKDKTGNTKPLYLRIARDTKIRRHVKIKSAATVFDRLYKDYFKQRVDLLKHLKPSATTVNLLGPRLFDFINPGDGCGETRQSGSSK